MMYLSKLEALTKVFELENLFKTWPTTRITAQQYLDTISKNNYSLTELNCSAGFISNLNRKLLPDRLKGETTKVCNIFLRRYKLKYCSHCSLVYSDELFFNNSSKKDGKEAYCKQCYNIIVRDYRKYQQAEVRANKYKRTVAWADLIKIREIYTNCPEGYHVDHIIPLNGEKVCGLHVHNNLQYLEARENILKSNTYVA